MINQLFTKQPSTDLAMRVINCFGLSGFQDDRWFSKHNMSATVTKLSQSPLYSELQDLYIPCKAKSYLSDINTRSALTILRQILRVHRFSLISRSRCHKGDRFLEYRIIPTV